MVLQMVSPACVPEGWEWEEESDPWPCSVFSSAQHFIATLRWFSTITHRQFKGSFSAAKSLCPTDGCWDHGLLRSHNKELMAGQIPKGVKVLLAPSHTEELTSTRTCRDMLTSGLKAVLLPFDWRLFPHCVLCDWITASVAAMAKFGILSNKEGQNVLETSPLNP